MAITIIESMDHLIIEIMLLLNPYNLLQTRGWKEWERETASDDYEFSNGISLQSTSFPMFKARHHWWYLSYVFNIFHMFLTILYLELTSL